MVRLLYKFGKVVALIIFILWQSCSGSFAQSVVSGTVTDASNGEVLPGVNIQVPGTTVGTATNSEGEYQLNVPSLQDTLVFSFVGFKTQEIPINGRSQIDVELQMQAIYGEEIVVTGYGEARKKELTSSISSIEGDELSQATVGDVGKALQGKVSGVQIVSNSGAPGSSSTIVIRGITSNQGVDPLIVVDGVPQPPGYNLNSLNSQTIKSVDVLKDASASAIYGARASNGVILVTTKRGRSGKDQTITFEGTYGFQTIDPVDVANASEYAQVMNQRVLNDNPNASLVYPNADSYGVGTDWWDEVYSQTAPTVEFNLGLSGGTEKVAYSGNVGYFGEKSQSPKGDWQRISARFNVDYFVNDNLTIKQDFNPKIINYNDVASLFSNTLRIDPLTGVYLPENEQDGRNQFSIFQRSNNLVSNPVAAAERSFGNGTSFSMFSNTQLEYSPIPNLDIKSQFGLTVGQDRRDDFDPEFFIDVLEKSDQSTVYRRYVTDYNYVLNNTITYQNDFGEHSLSILGGVILESNRNNSLYGSRDGAAGSEEKLRYLSLANGEQITATDGESVNRLFSLLSRIRYNYQEKYFLTAAIRRDASSSFPESNNYAVFPSISGAWEVTEEPFMDDVPYLNSLRLKAGYGEVGNQSIPGNASLFSVSNGDYIFGETENRVITAYLSRFGNENLKWETVKDYNAGIELSMFNNKFNLSVERYRRESIDNLYPTTYPQYAGSPSQVWQNVGSFEANGWDITANYNNQGGDFTYNVGLTFSTSESKAVSLTPGQEELLAQRYQVLGNRFFKITRVGDPVGLFYGLKTDGLFRSSDDVSNYVNDEGRPIQPNASAGDLKFVDTNGDGKIGEEDQTIIGNPFPDFNAGINVNLGYKRWDMSIQLYGTYGNDVLNFPKYYLTSGVQQANVRAGLLDDVWTPENRDASIPRLTSNDPNGNFKRNSDYFIEDGSYLRIKNLQVGYNIPYKSLDRLRVYVSAQNLFTFTKYSGLDPEVRSGGGFIDSYGVDQFSYPTPRTFLFGINMSL